MLIYFALLVDGIDDLELYYTLSLQETSPFLQFIDFQKVIDLDLSLSSVFQEILK